MSEKRKAKPKRWSESDKAIRATQVAFDVENEIIDTIKTKACEKGKVGLSLMVLDYLQNDLPPFNNSGPHVRSLYDLPKSQALKRIPPRPRPGKKPF